MNKGELLKVLFLRSVKSFWLLKLKNTLTKTVVVDVIDDVIEMIKNCRLRRINTAWKPRLKSLSEIPYGKGYDFFNQAITEMVIDLKALPMNVIYISRQVSGIWW